MGDANSAPRLSSEEKHQAIMDGLDVYSEVADLRRRLRETVTTWQTELSPQTQRIFKPLIEEHYNFAEPPQSLLLKGLGSKPPSLER